MLDTLPVLDALLPTLDAPLRVLDALLPVLDSAPLVLETPLVPVVPLPLEATTVLVVPPAPLVATVPELRPPQCSRPRRCFPWPTDYRQLRSHSRAMSKRCQSHHARYRLHSRLHR